jgi:hypothetical protein
MMALTIKMCDFCWLNAYFMFLLLIDFEDIVMCSD